MFAKILTKNVRDFSKMQEQEKIPNGQRGADRGRQRRAGPVERFLLASNCAQPAAALRDFTSSFQGLRVYNASCSSGLVTYNAWRRDSDASRRGRPKSKITLNLQFLHIFGGLLLGCIETDFCKKMRKKGQWTAKYQ